MYRVDLIVTIPTKDASPSLLPLIRDLRKAGFRRIVLVNDGCDPSCDYIFETAKEEYNCDVLTHVVHLGKGRSLKTAFNYILQVYPQCKGVITVDDAGRHCIEEVEECAEILSRYPEDLILGCRNFKNKRIPFWIRFNNGVTKRLIKILTGINVTDTTTGLRGSSIELVRKFLQVPGEGLDYELNVLLESKAQNIGIREFNTQVDYNGQALEAEYNPLLHSAKLYGVFVRYSMTSVIATIVDFMLFTTAVASTKISFPTYYIIISTIFARIFSGLLNFYLSKNTVFKNKDDARPMMIRFFGIVGAQMLLSAIFVTLLYRIMPITETLVKIIVDGILFLIFYQVQREWVFNPDAYKKDGIEEAEEKKGKE